MRRGKKYVVARTGCYARATRRSTTTLRARLKARTVPEVNSPEKGEFTVREKKAFDNMESALC